MRGGGSQPLHCHSPANRCSTKRWAKIKRSDAQVSRLPESPHAVAELSAVEVVTLGVAESLDVTGFMENIRSQLAFTAIPISVEDDNELFAIPGRVGRGVLVGEVTKLDARVRQLPVEILTVRVGVD